MIRPLSSSLLLIVFRVIFKLSRYSNNDYLIFQIQRNMMKDVETDIANYKPNMDGLEHTNQVPYLFIYVP